MKRQQRDLEDQKDDLSQKLKYTEKKNEDFNQKLFDMEKEVRLMIQEREKEIRDS